MNLSEKPVKEWLEMLIEPYRTQALANWNDQSFYSKHKIVSNLSSAICSAFHWNVSIESADYWGDLEIKISNRSEKYISISSEPQYSPF